jgi:microcystin-dependent protein
MSNPFVAEIRIFGFSFAPKGWAFCDGQLLPISQNTALFSLLGTFYGGDGKSTFALPDMQGSVPINQGQSSTGTEYFLGQQSGSETVTLLQTEMPLHTHQLMALGVAANRTNPIGNSIARTTSGLPFIAPNNNPAPTIVNMAVQTVPPNGGGAPHNNMMPYVTMNFCIAMQGVFPPRG